MKYLLATFLLLAAVPAPAVSETALYINHAPDIRYAEDGDARIAFIPGEGLYSFGHDFGKIEPCASNLDECIRFDFMALRALSESDQVGTSHREGVHEFRVTNESELRILGMSRRVLRVEVTMGGEPANAYLFDRERGVIAIIVYNEKNENIPESLFLLAACDGIFAIKKPTSGT
jgi:hypothetical protein